ncbi:UNVERIFIED_CONTAM: hypothetical protein FKN15_050277 [Acipenser sinensis]
MQIRLVLIPVVSSLAHSFSSMSGPNSRMSKQQTNQRPSSMVSETSTAVTSSTVDAPPGSKGSKSSGKVHSFGKRDHAIKRNPNMPVVARGWLYKQDSSGMRLWKRKWFVLADYCLFYYKDSREETVLGSISLPSYVIAPVEPEDHISRKYAFKATHTGMRSYIYNKNSIIGSQAEHCGMRTYYFSADTQEDMNDWIRAMNQAALMQTHTAEREADKMEKQAVPQTNHVNSNKGYTQAEVPPKQERTLRPVGEMLGFEKREEIHKESEDEERYGFRKDTLEDKNKVKSPATVVEVDSLFTEPVGSSRTQPVHRNGTLPSARPAEQNGNPVYKRGFVPRTDTEKHVQRKTNLSQVSGRDSFKDRSAKPVRIAESDVDAKLSRLCEQDKTLQDLEAKIRILKEDKDKLESVLDVSHRQMEQYKEQPAHAEKIACQQRLLQEDLVQIRAEISRISTEMENAWSEYGKLEMDVDQLGEVLQEQMNRTILSQLTTSLKQEKSQMLKDLWRIEDVMAGLSSSKANYKFTIDSVQNPERQIVPSMSSLSVPSLSMCVSELESRSFMQRSPQLSPSMETRLQPQKQLRPQPHMLQLQNLQPQSLFKPVPKLAEEEAPPRPPLPYIYSPDDQPPAVPPLPKEASVIRHTSVRGLKRQSDERKKDREFGQYVNGDYKWKREQEFDLQLLERALRGEDKGKEKSDDWLTVHAVPMREADLEPQDYDLDISREPAVSLDAHDFTDLDSALQEQERIITMSYALASEASQKSKQVAAEQQVYEPNAPSPSVAQAPYPPLSNGFHYRFV